MSEEDRCHPTHTNCVHGIFHFNAVSVSIRAINMHEATTTPTDAPCSQSDSFRYQRNDSPRKHRGIISNEDDDEDDETIQNLQLLTALDGNGLSFQLTMRLKADTDGGENCALGLSDCQFLLMRKSPHVRGNRIDLQKMCGAV